MPLYDCMLLLKPNVTKEALMDLVSRVGQHVYRRNGVLTDLKSFGTVQLGYGIKKLDGRYYQSLMVMQVANLFWSFSPLDGVASKLMEFFSSDSLVFRVYMMRSFFIDGVMWPSTGALKFTPVV
ncbi:UNVERIFIED_CONTAM: hypothetical protein Slati_1152300 [Sesamum latifolium]|uniref:Ribosomal protein S6 n=1 Tax=Sesamum latifolium TaxID=2727402 RepID=A0AAW2XFW5_9LAMI